MKYTQSSFSVAAPGTDQYRENWDRIFKKDDLSMVKQSCNLHTSCEAAEEERGTKLAHCWDPDCDDCFGR